MEGSESWVWQKKNECIRINAVEMRSLRSMCGVSWKGRCRNGDVRERCGLKEDVSRLIRKSKEIDASQAERLGGSCLSVACYALSLARSAQAERDNESCFFSHTYVQLGRYHNLTEYTREVEAFAMSSSE
ncbi:hypothetical protein EVAR_89027_1 [Eumeta japonica]|uniref:Uncharacterized protein n=1 Tax=Eumeta variegata TaxID=151549 RepID=A0A4C1X830_EUMVA|nr:hypothetical protein EVAR_89027_1 [Eumeta japonica]